MKVSRFIDEEVAAQAPNVQGTDHGSSEPVVNVCGVLVHAAPGQSDAVTKMLNDLPGVEIHVASPDDRFVLTIEDVEDCMASECLAAIAEMPGVMNSSLVYHHFESKDSMEREETPS
ncbi:chaperone NapD [Magnetospira sp. QH-2]|uniref:chaperone NapD n=1 Tax=Magnetospira sp. (strain QH-2) TaxID=1288970 RepID=UPI0003E80EE0|nr:chaperone NapD [Magnetospira sp. QH-2]CCQ73121.1 nitrate reductase protein NapD [Magnetospira sp. QH-2]